MLWEQREGVLRCAWLWEERREFQREGEDSPHYLGRKMAIKHPSIRGNHITWEGGRNNIVIIEPS